MKRVHVLDKDICSSHSDLTIVPCSGKMKKVEKPRNQARIDFYGLPSPLDLKDEFTYGKVSPIFPPTKNVGKIKYFAFAASVFNCADPVSLERIGEQIGAITRENTQIRVVEAPFLGCGDGGLHPGVAMPALAKGFLASSHPDAVLQLCSDNSLSVSVAKAAIDELFRTMASEEDAGKDNNQSSLREKKAEILRLIDAFEAEAAKYHDIQLSTFLVSQNGTSSDRQFSSPNHTILLWQYYGLFDKDEGSENLLKNLQESNIQWGVRGAKLSSFAVVEGDMCGLFVKMANRAGSLFCDKEAKSIKSRVLNEIIQSEKASNPSAKPVAVTNDNPLAIWLNFLLYHLSMTNPGRDRLQRIEPDPFTLSLLALERLAVDLAIGKIDRSARSVQDINFKVAMSFPGENRDFVDEVVNTLRPVLGPDAVFYDYDYQAQLARPNLDTLLQDTYRKRSDLIVVFLCKEYANKQWCGLEWRAIRDIIKSKEDDRLMFVRFDDTPVDGVFSIDGYIDGRVFSAKEVANFIVSRLDVISNKTNQSA